jgi:hypothetical protein
MLQISDSMALPDEAVTETFAMLAKRGMGKSNAAVVMAEEMTRGGEQWIAIDPKGDWWGVRSDAKGTGPGLSVPVFGGRHGDIPLESTAGTMLAHLIVDRSLTCVLDVSLFSKAEQIRFVTDFAEALFKAAADDPAPRHLFVEEAEEFLPQRVDARSARMVGAYSKIAKQGRTSGLGVTLITQRSASLNKDALSQTDTLILFRTVSPHDRKAVVAWAEHHAESLEIASTLAQLAPGESWVLSPGFLGSIERVTWRRRRTFDSGATPAMGRAKRKAPVSLADINLAEIKEQMAETVERAKADDPKLLRKRIADLERQIANARPEVREVEVITEVRVEVVPLWVSDELRTLAARIEDLDPPPAPIAHPTPPTRPNPSPNIQYQRDEPWASGGSDAGLSGPQRKVLAVLATYGPVSKRRLAMQAGYSAKGGAFNNTLSRLRTAGYIDRADPIGITWEGMDALGPFDPLPRGQALVDHWLRQLTGPSRKVIEALMASGSPMTKAELADATGYESTGGAFNNTLSRLRTLELITKEQPIELHPDFEAALNS